MFPAVLIVILILVYFTAAGMAVARRRHPPEPQQPDPRRLALEFRGVVVANDKMAHAFDAGYSARIKIKCDDGSTVTLDTSIFHEARYPVGMRVIKRAGATMPERDPDPPADA